MLDATLCQCVDPDYMAVRKLVEDAVQKARSAPRPTCSGYSRSRRDFSRTSLRISSLSPSAPVRERIADTHHARYVPGEGTMKGERENRCLETTRSKRFAGSFVLRMRCYACGWVALALPVWTGLFQDFSGSQETSACTGRASATQP